MQKTARINQYKELVKPTLETSRERLKSLLKDKTINRQLTVSTLIEKVVSEKITLFDTTVSPNEDFINYKTTTIKTYLKKTLSKTLKELRVDALYSFYNLSEEDLGESKTLITPESTLKDLRKSLYDLQKNHFKNFLLTKIVIKE